MIVYGRNSVLELLRASPRDVRRIMVSENFDVSAFPEIRNGLEKFRIRLERLPKNALAGVCGSPRHQGVAAETADFSYCSVEDILSEAKSRGERVFMVVLDHVEDPRNFGAVARTADFLGAHGMVIPADRACEVTPAVIRVSAGACSGMKIAREKNLGRVVDSLKKKGVWMVGADAGSPDALFECDLSGLDVAVVIGNEGRGMRSGTKRRCDFVLSVPAAGKVESLNASVAGGIFLYEVYRQRLMAASS